MKTTLRALALVGLIAAIGALWLRTTLPPRLLFRAGIQETSTTAPKGTTVRGLVLHEGAPVAGARVRLIPLRQERRAILISSPLILKAETDAEGRFEVIGAPEGRARLSVFPDRFAPAQSEIDVSPTTPDVTVALETGLAIEARVAAGSHPVAGAAITVRLVGHDFAHERRPFREAATDAEGRFRMEGFDGGRPFRLTILAEGHRPFEKTFPAPQEMPDLLNLATGLQITGRVVTASGDPVAGVDLQAGQGEAYIAAGRSGPAGEVRIGGLVQRPVTIRARAPGYASAKLDLPSPASGWTLILRRQGGVAGRAPSAAWLVIETSGATYRRAIGADGTFSWNGLPSGPAEARATDRGGRVLASKKVEIPEGGVAEGILLEP